MSRAQRKPRVKHSCDIKLSEDYPAHSQASDGERWRCSCGLIYEHVCDEAEGCKWILLGLRPLTARERGGR